MIERQRALIESEIKNLAFGKEPKSLYEPIRYIMSLGGKRLRPLMTLLSYSLYKENWESIVRYSVAVEAFHNFTLIHDDIMDNAPLRRGKPTVHEKWNVNTAILSGDVMLVKVYDMFLGLDGEKLKQVMALFNDCASGVCEGQQLDMVFEAKKVISEEDYISMIRLKTAVLLGFSLELGAVLAGAPKGDQALLREAGIHLGIGFQLKDDWLDVYGDKKKFGKQIGGDILANKKTFLLVQAMKKARGEQKKSLNRWLSARNSTGAKKIAAVTKLYDQLGIKELTQARTEKFFQKGFELLSQLSVGKKTAMLESFAKDLAARQH